MEMATNTRRKDAPEKVTGQARYTADCAPVGTVYAALAQSPFARGKITRLSLEGALAMPGVLCAFGGDPAWPLTGPLVQDRPILAVDRVRYAGEPVALVVAQTTAQAAAAASRVRVEVQQEAPVLNTADALAAGAPLVHEGASAYAHLVEDVAGQAGTNIAALFQVQKGDPDGAWKRCAAQVRRRFTLPASVHAAMEPRVAQAELRADGTLWLMSATQSPYAVRELVAQALHMDEGMVEVETPYVGGAYGGKSTVQLEYLVALAAVRLPGRRVLLELSREQDMSCAPTRMGLSADVRLGLDGNNRLLAADMLFTVDCGAYADIGPYMAKAVAVDCTGPYDVEHLRCRVRCVYTNHCYVTAFRGFAHESVTFCVERALDELARAAGVDALLVRANSAIREGDLTPTQVTVTRSNLGNLPACIASVKRQLHWDEGTRLDLGNGIIRAKGVACLWKTPNPSFDASAGAVITFNDDGSANLNVGVVEMGNGGVTCLAEFLAEALRIPYDKVHVTNRVNTRTAPKYWKTVASLSCYLAGRAVMQAAQDALNQLKQNASIALRLPVEDLEHGQGRIYARHQPKFAIGYQDLAFGVAMPDGNSVGAPVIGRGSFVLNHVGPLAKGSGKGKTGHSWTVAAQGVEVEWDAKDDTYRLVRAVTAMDVGAAVNPAAMVSMLRGGMSMGLSLARDEQCVYDAQGRLESGSLRTYKPLHIGEEPTYCVELLCTPQLDAPYGMRSYSEHGIIGMPAALGNALSLAAGAPLDQLPLTPESIWRARKGEEAQ